MRLCSESSSRETIYIGMTMLNISLILSLSSHSRFCELIRLLEERAEVEGGGEKGGNY